MTCQSCGHHWTQHAKNPGVSPIPVCIGDPDCDCPRYVSLAERQTEEWNETRLAEQDPLL